MTSLSPKKKVINFQIIMESYFNFSGTKDASTREKPTWRKTAPDSTGNETHVGRFRRMRLRAHQDDTGSPANTSTSQATPQVRCHVPRNRHIFK